MAQTALRLYPRRRAICAALRPTAQSFLSSATSSASQLMGDIYTPTPDCRLVYSRAGEPKAARNAGRATATHSGSLRAQRWSCVKRVRAGASEPPLHRAAQRTNRQQPTSATRSATNGDGEYHVPNSTKLDRSPSGRPDRTASGLPGWQIEAVWQRNPNNGLPLGGIARDVPPLRACPPPG